MQLLNLCVMHKVGTRIFFESQIQIRSIRTRTRLTGSWVLELWLYVIMLLEFFRWIIYTELTGSTLPVVWGVWKEPQCKSHKEQHIQPSITTQKRGNGKIGNWGRWMNNRPFKRYIFFHTQYMFCKAGLYITNSNWRE